MNWIESKPEIWIVGDEFYEKDFQNLSTYYGDMIYLLYLIDECYLVDKIDEH